MGDIDQMQFQTQQTHDVANQTGAEQVDAENTSNQLHENNVHSINKGEWMNEEKLMQIHSEERQKGKSFMKRIKRWNIEFPQKKRATQNLVDNANGPKMKV